MELSRQESRSSAGKNHGGEQAIVKELSRHEQAAPQTIIKELNRD